MWTHLSSTRRWSNSEDEARKRTEVTVSKQESHLRRSALWFDTKKIKKKKIKISIRHLPPHVYEEKGHPLYVQVELVNGRRLLAAVEDVLLAGHVAGIAGGGEKN